MSYLLSVYDAQKELDAFHPRVLETRERFDGELYERTVWPNGQPPTISRTYLIYAEGYGYKYYAVADVAGIGRYRTHLDFNVISRNTSLAQKLLKSGASASISDAGTTWWVLSENGKDLRTVEQCQSIAWRYQLGLDLEEFRIRLATDTDNLMRFPELSMYAADIQYGIASCSYFLEQANDDIATFDEMLQELLRFESEKLISMREKCVILQQHQLREIEKQQRLKQRQQKRLKQRQQIYIDKVLHRHQRLWRYELTLAEHPELETYRALLEQEWISQLHFDTQTLRYIDELEPLIQKANEREALVLSPILEQAKSLNLRSLEQSSSGIDRQQLDEEQVGKLHDANIVEQLKKRRDQQEQKWHEEQAKVSTGETRQTSSIPTAPETPITYTDASKKRNILIDHLSAGGNVLVIKQAATELCQKCKKSRDAIPSDQTHQNITPKKSNENDCATAGAIIGGIIGLLGGPFGAVIGAAIGGMAGANIEDNTKESSGVVSSNRIPNSERMKWELLIREIDNLINSLPNE